MTYVQDDDEQQEQQQRFAGKCLAKELRKRKIKPTPFARSLGVEYQTLWRWMAGKNFNRQNQQLVIDALELAADAFTDPRAVARREAKRSSAFDAWQLESAYAQTASERELRFLRRLLPDDPDFEPDSPWYDVQLALFRKLKVRFDAADKNRALDAEIRAEDSPKHRAKRLPSG